jgi:hypothetical protein
VGIHLAAAHLLEIDQNVGDAVRIDTPQAGAHQNIGSGLRILCTRAGGRKDRGHPAAQIISGEKKVSH